MSKASSQQFLEIAEIKEGVLVLKNKTMRGVLLVSSLNFALKSEEEQEAIIYQFQSFLNSLDFSLQVCLQSKKLNITGYLEKLKDLEEKQENELLKMQTEGYRKFINEMVAGGAIMNKTFFVVVPFAFAVPPVSDAKGAMSVEVFQRGKNQLWQRMEYVASGLRRCGLQCASLNTSELIELFWSIHHPEESEVGYYPEIPPEILGETTI